MSKIKICLDAGHYGKYNRSPAVKSYYESDMTWKITQLQKKYLDQLGFEVILTRTNKDKDLALYNRGTASKGCALFISNHSNAVGSGVNESVDYPVAIVPLSGKGDAIGKKLVDCIAATMGTKQPGKTYSRASGTKEWYGVLRGAAAVGTVGLILEHSFHTNSRSTKWLLDDANLDKLARAEAQTIAEYFSKSKPEPVADYTLGMRILREGCEGEDVKALQDLLKANGCDCGKSDGIYGKKTGDAVEKFQGKRGLTEDRVAGADTMGALLGV